MIQSHYSIIPISSKNYNCASCGKEIKGLPYFIQVAQFLKCIRNEEDFNIYFSISLGNPMCDDCYDKIMNKINRIENVYFIIFLIALGIIIAALVYCLKSEDNSPEGFLCMLIVFGLSIYVIFSEKLKNQYINWMMEKYGKTEIIKPYEYLINNGWTQEINVSDPAKTYTIEALKIDLDEICKDGTLGVLDNETGYIVDHNDPEILNNLYSRCIWVSRKYELAD